MKYLTIFSVLFFSITFIIAILNFVSYQSRLDNEASWNSDYLSKEKIYTIKDETKKWNERTFITNPFLSRVNKRNIILKYI